MTYNSPKLIRPSRPSRDRDVQNGANRQLLSVVFTDIKGFSAITEKNEEHALSHVSRYRDVVLQTTEKHSGTLVHFYGDGSLSVHTSALAAVKCAMAMQRAFSDAGDAKDKKDQHASIPVRIGIHLGEVVMTDDTVYGNAVNIAARLQAMASAQSILISGAVAHELENHPEVTLHGLGKHYFKNIQERIDVFAVKESHLVIPKARLTPWDGQRARRYPHLALILAAMALLAFFLTDGLRFAGKNIIDERIVVLPFENRTGDPSLDNFSGYASAYITQLMEAEDKIKIASTRDMLEGGRLETFNTIPYSAIVTKTNAENFIHGFYSQENDSTIRLSSALVDGSTGEFIQQFEDQLIDLHNLNPGLVATTQHIVGFIISAEFHPLSTPTEKAFKAYMEALRVYGRNYYADSRQLVLDAIGYDSTFLDAYITLSDTYHNMGQYVQADSVMQVIHERFKPENLTRRQRNTMYFYDAFNAGHNSAAYKYLLNEYQENPEDLFRNTTTASYALFFVNDARHALKILKKIPFRKIDMELPVQRHRITTALQANFALGNYRKAYKLAQLYPSYEMTLLDHKMRIRAFAGRKDTAAINDELAQIAINTTPAETVEAHYWTSQQFRLLGKADLTTHYLGMSYHLTEKNAFKGSAKAEVLYDLGRYQEGIGHAHTLYNYAPYWLPYASLVGRGYALAGIQDSARHYCEVLRQLKPNEQYRGQASYLEATIFTALGDHQSALIKLQNAVDEGCVFYEYNMEFDPRLMPLFGMDEFEDISHPLE